MTLTGAADYPDRLRLVTEGFIEACSQVAQSNALWRSERVSPDCIIFRADRDFGN